MRAAILSVVVLSALAACSDPDATPPDASVYDAAPSRGFFTLSWTVTQGGAPATCADVGGDLIRVTMHPQSGAVGFVELFDCATGMGTSALRDADVYDVELVLTRTSGDPVAAEPITGFTIQPGSTVTMPAATFDVPAP